MIIAAPGKLRLHRAGQTIPIPVVVYGRVIIGGVIVRVSVVVVGVPPIRKTKRNEVKSEEEPVVMVKEMVVPVAVKESTISETMITMITNITMVITITMVPNIVPRSKLMTRSVSRRTVSRRRTMSSTSRESSTAMTGHGARRRDRKRGGHGRGRKPMKKMGCFHTQRGRYFARSS